MRGAPVNGGIISFSNDQQTMSRPGEQVKINSIERQKTAEAHRDGYSR
jgi:hypothetical protein